jgi:hypothetical protein
LIRPHALEGLPNSGWPLDGDTVYDLVGTDTEVNDRFGGARIANRGGCVIHLCRAAGRDADTSTNALPVGPPSNKLHAEPVARRFNNIPKK